MAAILFIPIYDLIVSGAPLRSELWLQFFTVLFVLSFVIECARSFLVGYVTNLRHVRQIEKEHEKSKAAYKAKTEFISTISHELRTPLTSIKGSLQLLESGVAGDLPEKAAPLLTIANRNSARLSELIEGILTFQESEAGRLTYDFQDLELKSLTTGVVDRMTSYAEGLGVQIEQPAGDQEYWVNADPERLEQVVTNILSNAVKFSHKDGSVRLRFEQVDGIVRLSISDDGIGIPADKSELIFEQFSQIDSSDERSYEGSGLGMSVSSAIIAGHGGKIDFTSEEGVGTTFFFELPAVARPDIEAADESPKPPETDLRVASAS
nr:MULTISPECIES: HAMP domain-containing sensor histidine kinase [unclassified Roseobacter]